jgi:hypothetical protein
MVLLTVLLLVPTVMLTACAGGSPSMAQVSSEVSSEVSTTGSSTAPPDWLWDARLATAAGEDWEAWTEEVDTAVADGATVMLGWDHFQGTRWQTLFEPELSEALAQTQRRAQWVHERHPGVRYIIYMAPLEATIEGIDEDGDGRVDPGMRDDSLALQHPDWAQVGIDGRPAVFYGSMPDMPFWVCPSCEDVWLTPANAEFRSLLLEQLGRLATDTELDGVWHDVPFLMGGYFGEGWPEGQFPDVGPEARALYRTQTGMTLPAPPLAPDWSDDAWLRFVGWRFSLIDDYMDAVRSAVTSADRDFAFIPESSVAFDAALTQLAASPADLPASAHTTAHELGGTSRPVQFYTWLKFVATLQAWRHLDLAHGETSWLLSYVEAGHDDTADVARLHAATTELSGFRTLTSGNEGMGAVVDAAFRRELFGWLDDVGAPLADPGLRPVADVAVVFSQQTLDFVGRGSWESDYSSGFYGALMTLLEAHVPFEVIPDRDLERIKGFETVILPGTESLGDEQAHIVREYVAGGGQLLATGYTSLRDEQGIARDELALADVFGTTLAEIEADETVVHENEYGSGLSVLSPEQHELWYYWEGDPEDDEAPSDAEAAIRERDAFLQLLGRMERSPAIQTDAAPSVVVLPYAGPHGDVRLAVINLTGVDSNTAVPASSSFTVTLSLGLSEAADAANAPRAGTMSGHETRRSAGLESIEDEGQPPASWIEILEAPEDVVIHTDASGRTTLRLSVYVGGMLRLNRQAQHPKTLSVDLPLLLQETSLR